MGKADGLTTVLVGCNLGNDLGSDVAGGGEGVGLFDASAGNNRAVLQHILQVYQIAVVHMLGIVVGVMEVDDTGIVGIHDLLGEQDAAGNILGDLAGHVVTLNRIDGRILIGVFLLDFLVVTFDQTQNAIVSGVGLAHQTTGVTVGDVGLGNLKGTMSHNGLFHQILNFFNSGTSAHLLAGDLHMLGDALDLQRSHADVFFRCFIGFGNGRFDLLCVKDFFRAIAFNDLHIITSLVSGDCKINAQDTLYYILWFLQ